MSVSVSGSGSVSVKGSDVLPEGRPSFAGEDTWMDGTSPAASARDSCVATPLVLAFVASMTPSVRAMTYDATSYISMSTHAYPCIPRGTPQTHQHS